MKWNNLFNRLRGVHPRTYRALLNSLWGIFIKGGSMGINLLLVPLTLRCLGNTTFGVWTTLSSLLTLLAFLDIGLGNGLRNRLTEALSKNDLLLARSYVSTAYAVYGGLQAVLLLLFGLGHTYLPWAALLNTTVDDRLLRQLALILFVGVSLKLVLDLLTFVFYARQQPAKAGLLLLLTNALMLAGVYWLAEADRGSLLNLGVVQAACPVLVLLIASVWQFTGPLRHLRPTWPLVRMQHLRGLLGLGIRFFVIQMAVIVIFYSDNLLITHLFGPAEVTPYTIAFRYFGVISTLFSILLTPFWSAFTEAHVRDDYGWMQRTYRRLWLFWGGAIALILIWIVTAPTAYALWIGKRVVVPGLLSICMGIATAITCFNNIVVVVINGLGKIRIQLLTAIASAVVNVPLCVLLGQYAGMGSGGVALATALSLLIGSVVCFLQAEKLLSRTAVGLWNR
jgi:O-antigen/teichoic acid export membrane protein